MEIYGTSQVYWVNQLFHHVFTTFPGEKTLEKSRFPPSAASGLYCSSVSAAKTTKFAKPKTMTVGSWGAGGGVSWNYFGDKIWYMIYHIWYIIYDIWNMVWYDIWYDMINNNGPNLKANVRHSFYRGGANCLVASCSRYPAFLSSSSLGTAIHPHL